MFFWGIMIMASERKGEMNTLENEKKFGKVRFGFHNIFLDKFIPFHFNSIWFDEKNLNLEEYKPLKSDITSCVTSPENFSIRSLVANKVFPKGKVFQSK